MATFNGAAVLGPRRASSFKTTTAPNWYLQWGRGLGTAERVRASRQSRSAGAFNGAAVLGPRRGQPRERYLPAIEVPSMGPRSWDRGEAMGNRARQLQGAPFNGAAVL